MSSQNKQYGLIKPKQASQTQPVKKPSVFDEDSDSMDETNMSSSDWIKKSYQKEAEKGYQKREVKKQLDKALEDDPSVFQYDEVYDELQSKKSETVKAKKDVHRKPRYIQSLLAQADRRKRENEYRNERLIQKEREAEGELFKDKETFVTSAYRKKLEEFKKLDEMDQRQNMLEEIGDVTKQKDLSGFYRHLYETTVGGKEKDSKSGLEKIKLCKSPVPSSGTQDENTVVKSEPDLESNSISKSSSKTRHYRKRNKSCSSSDEKSEEIEVKRKKVNAKNADRKSADKNLDADTDISSSSSSSESSSSDSSSSSSDSENESEPEKIEKMETDLISGSEEGEIVESSERKPKELTKASLKTANQDLKTSIKKEKSATKKVKHSSESIKDSKSVEVKSEDIVSDADKSDEKIEEKEEKKINIWEKRTVGEVFDGALKRFLERKAARNRGC